MVVRSSRSSTLASLRLPSPRAVICDLDQTLVDTRTIKALRMRSGAPLAALQGTLVQVAGTITRVDGNSAYMDDGSGQALLPL